MASDGRIQTTHTGSLPRPQELAQLLRAKHSGSQYDKNTFNSAVSHAVGECVKVQVQAGIDIVSDGEMSKVSYSYYAQDRLQGMSPAARAEDDGLELRQFQKLETVDTRFPDYADAVFKAGRPVATVPPPVCTGALAYNGFEALETDITNLQSAAAAANAPACFMTASSPGVIAMFASRTSYFTNEEDYVFALADAMKPEFEAIHAAGITLQIDCPDLALAPQMNYGDPDRDPGVTIARNIEALNHATAGIPGDGVRVHLCWGNYPGPHVSDLEVKNLFPYLRKLGARGLSFEAANPRHQHEWEDWKSAALPDDMVLIPGVVDSTSNFVEHPRLVAQRIANFCNAVGKDRVIAGVDCGFGTFGTAVPYVYPSIVWEKLKSLAQGAEIASR